VFVVFCSVNQLLSDGQTLALITNETPVRQRQQIYLRGGCLSVTSRILIVDLLCHHVPPSIISGLVVSDAHQCNDMSVEAFILRVFRQHNRTGCIKALSDNPFSFTNGFAKVEKIMQSLFVKKLLLWPRFHAAVSESLNVQPPDVVEIEQPLTSAMSEIHNVFIIIYNPFCLVHY
jgi:DNA excision repair protein ERCC-4